MQTVPWNAVRDWANTALSARALRDEIASHLATVIVASRASAAYIQFQRVNILLGKLKTAINGTYHAFKFTKYVLRDLSDLPVPLQSTL